MEKIAFHFEDYYKALIKTSQFLATLTDLKHIWTKLDKIFSKYISVEIFTFLEKNKEGDITPPKLIIRKEEIYNKILEHIKNTIFEVLESGILASDLIHIPESICVTLIPILKLNQISVIILIAEKRDKPLPKELLNIYLALGGAIGNTVDKLTTIKRLRNHQKYLESMVEERTVELMEINKKLNIEIFHREKAEETTKQFLSTVSHELRTPVSVLIQGINNLNKYKDRVTPEIRMKIMNSISQNIVLLSDLLEDLLIISRVDEKRIVLKMEKYYFSEVINEVLELMEPRRAEKEIEIELYVDKDIFSYGDRKRIGQIFRIFIDNAIKYSKEKSKIEIRALDPYKGNYNPTSIDATLIQFTDHGIGIEKEEIPNLFKRFFRSENVRAISGTGLGLAIAKELTQLHKGDIFVKSEFGKGTTFSIFLPRIKQ